MHVLRAEGDLLLSSLPPGQSGLAYTRCRSALSRPRCEVGAQQVSSRIFFACHYCASSTGCQALQLLEAAYTYWSVSHGH